MKLSRFAQMLALSAALLGSAGCGEKGDGLLLGEVAGVVRLDGQPLSGALVEFNPKSSPVQVAEKKKSVASGGSTGLTDATGTYRLHFDNQREGAVLGTHVVRVTAIPPANPDDRPVQLVFLPPHYNVQSTLTFDVKEGRNTYDLDLKTR